MIDDGTGGRDRRRTTTQTGSGECGITSRRGTIVTLHGVGNLCPVVGSAVNGLRLGRVVRLPLRRLS